MAKFVSAREEIVNLVQICSVQRWDKIVYECACVPEYLRLRAYMGAKCEWANDRVVGRVGEDGEGEREKREMEREMEREKEKKGKGRGREKGGGRRRGDRWGVREIEEEGRKGGGGGGGGGVGRKGARRDMREIWRKGGNGVRLEGMGR